MAKRMRDLFQRPMAELREAFVRTRFAEEHCFGRPDIETWLAHEREAERPEYDQDAPEYDLDADESPWNVLLSSDHMISASRKRELELLTTLATPLTEMPKRLPASDREREQLAEVEHLLAMIDRTRVDTYYGYTQGPVFPILVTGSSDGDHAVACDLDEIVGRQMVLRALDSGHVMEAIFAEWLYGRPRWREARQFICDALAKDVAKERQGADLDFDMAVAVSADGTEIVHANFVVTSTRVLGTNDKPFAPEEVRRIPAANFFLDHKVLLCAASQRTRMPIAACSENYGPALAAVLGACASDVPRQVFAVMNDGNKILVTHPDLVPEIENLDAPPEC